MITAINYLHKQGICHRDLKPDNVLIDEMQERGPRIKITDFGYSTNYEQAESDVLKLQLGSLVYMAPELLTGDRKHDNLVDIWAAGVLTYQLLSPENPGLPFFGASKAEIVKSIT